MALPDFPIPVISFFMSGNAFCGSHRGMNYRITPVKADVERDIFAHLAVVIWYGMLCSEKSEMEAEETFPLDIDGLKATRDWLIAQYATHSEN